MISMKRFKLIGLIFLVLMSVTGYAQCDFKTFLNTYFENYDANDSLIELGVNRNWARKNLPMFSLSIHAI